MKQMLLKLSFFTIPFIGLYLLNRICYNPHEGDLVRLGFLFSNPSPKSQINKQYQLRRQFISLSELDLNKSHIFNVLIIGDSYSEQDTLGYKNFLAQKKMSVLYVDRFISGGNPIQTLVELLNSDFFDRIRVDHIVLQSSERQFNQRNEGIKFNKSFDIETLDQKIKRYNNEVSDTEIRFFSDATLKIPLTNIFYLFEPKPYFSQTFKFKSTRTDLFSGEPDELLFYQDDIHHLSIKNDAAATINSIKTLDSISNLAEKKNSKLLVLVSPDKYDLYFPYIKNKETLQQPVFFPIYNTYPKSYTNIDAFTLLTEKLITEKDIYFYDDTHWSPKGAGYVADEIFRLIDK